MLRRVLEFVNFQFHNLTSTGSPLANFSMTSPLIGEQELTRITKNLIASSGLCQATQLSKVLIQNLPKKRTKTN